MQFNMLRSCQTNQLSFICRMCMQKFCKHSFQAKRSHWKLQGCIRPKVLQTPTCDNGGKTFALVSRGAWSLYPPSVCYHNAEVYQLIIARARLPTMVFSDEFLHFLLTNKLAYFSSMALKSEFGNFECCSLMFTLHLSLLTENKTHRKSFRDQLQSQCTGSHLQLKLGLLRELGCH